MYSTTINTYCSQSWRVPIDFRIQARLLGSGHPDTARTPLEIRTRLTNDKIIGQNGVSLATYIVTSSIQHNQPTMSHDWCPKLLIKIAHYRSIGHGSPRASLYSSNRSITVTKTSSSAAVQVILDQSLSMQKTMMNMKASGLGRTALPVNRLGSRMIARMADGPKETSSGQDSYSVRCMPSFYML